LTQARARTRMGLKMRERHEEKRFFGGCDDAGGDVQNARMDCGCEAF
jgi:hypothetical protein